MTSEHERSIYHLKFSSTHSTYSNGFAHKLIQSFRTNQLIRSFKSVACKNDSHKTIPFEKFIFPCHSTTRQRVVVFFSVLFLCAPSSKVNVVRQYGVFVFNGGFS